MRTKDAWATSQQQYQACIDSMMMEKEELVRRHTIETGELRQKNAILMEQVQRFDGTAPSAPNGFASDFPDFGELPAGVWDDFPAPAPAPRFTLEAEPAPAPPALPAPSPADRPAEGNAASTDGDDKSVASGILLMLLLCGAWVASRGGSGNPASPAPPLPAIPDEVRAASAHLLDDLYRDSGVALDGAPLAADPATGNSDPGAPFGTPQQQQQQQQPLDALHRRLTAPSPQQLREQAFVLTPGQYNRIAGEDAALLSPPPTAPLEGSRRMAKSLADAVSAAAAQAVASGSEGAAEGYTRSLMRDKVSTQVLEDFARMVGRSKFGGPMG